MITKISLTVGKQFQCTKPLRTGPDREFVSGEITKINLEAGKVEITFFGFYLGQHELKAIKCYVISLEDALTKNMYLEVEED